MPQLSRNSLAIPKAIADAIVAWRGFAFRRTMDNVERDLSGKRLKRITGATLENVKSRSRETLKGFVLVTTMPHLIARELGSPRKAFFVKPTSAKALRFVKNGKVIFSRGHVIPPWRFPQMQIFEDAYLEAEDDVVARLEKEMLKAMESLFPDVRFRAEVSIGDK